MAPQPLTTIIRTNRRSAAGPSIYAIHRGPQRGVHLLSAEGLDPALQYLYRHPINVHRTFLTVSGDFLRRRFESIEAAVRWIDEKDREEELVEGLGCLEVGTGKRKDLPLIGKPEWQRSMEPVYGMRSGSGITKKVVVARGRFSRSHTGARRQELLYNLVCDDGGGEGSNNGSGKEEKVAGEKVAGEKMEVEEEL